MLMMDSTRTAISAAVLSSARPGRRSSSRAASAGTHGAEPIAPATSAIHNSGVRYHATVYGVGTAAVIPDIDARNAIAPGRVSARKKTQPIITMASVYTWGQIGQANTPEVGELVRWCVGALA